MPRLFVLFICGLLCTFAWQAQAAEVEKPKILIIKNSADDETHAFITKALVPSRRGAQFEAIVAEADYLASKPLDGFASIFLNDVAELTNAQYKALNEAVKGGVGLCMLLGPNSKVEHYNRVLYAEGKGLFPLPLGKPANMPEGETGIVAAKHPVLKVFEGEGKAMLDIVLVNRCHTPAADWKPDDVKGLHVIARSAAGQPVALSKPHGDGNVVVFLFVPDRRWANWHFYPAWVVMLHELQTFMTEY